MHGGRGSGKSFTAAKMAAVWGAIEPLRILCVRELQNSIKESFHAELKNAIQSCPWLSTQYNVGVDYLRHNWNGTEFIFRGLRHNVESVKSMAQVDLVIAEEAETIPAASWHDLLPTIRIDKSEFWIIYNPKIRKSWVAETFQNNPPPPRAQIVEMNWGDNPFFSEVLNEQRLDQQSRLDPALYAHIWEGKFYESSQAQVFNGKYKTDYFTPEANWDGPYFGFDFGFSQDESAGVKAWIYDGNLYIEHELYEKHLEIDATAAKMIELLPDIDQHAVRADNARPESISYLKRHGIRKIESCKKGAGSVEDGIEFIKSFKKVIVHSRCVKTLNEFNLYSYKIDRHSGDILNAIVDDYNHAIDALRYALEPIMRRKKKAGIAL
jgi:phage terminase large subunit